jgi:FKBP-type peptidyl-prolyl cis-trans isomerase FkpA
VRLAYNEFFKTKSMNIKYYKSIIVLFVAGLIISLVSCNPAKKYEKAEKELVSNYLNTHSTDTFALESSGLYYRDVVVGTGLQPQVHDTAYVIYTGKLLNGTIFDTNANPGDKLLISPVGERLLIAGFDEGITYMKAGGKAQFLVPSNLGYGTDGYYIAGYTPLLFEVTLVKVVPGPGK